MTAVRRIGVNLCWLVPEVVGGSEESITRTLRAIRDLGPDDVELVLFAQPAFADAHPDLAAAFETHLAPGPVRRKLVRVGVEHTWLPMAVRRAGLDAVHDAGGTSPGAISLPRVLTVHDIQPLEIPQNFNPMRVAYLRRAIPAAVEGAARVLVPSAFVKRRLVENLGCPAGRIDVVPWPLPPHEPADSIDLVRANNAIVGRIILMPAVTYAHKEHVVAIRAMQHLAGRHKDTTLVLTGGEGPHEQVVLDEIDRLGLRTRVVRLGRVPTATLAALYEESEVVVWPSIYEGFGNPVLEAMATGTPVIVADAGASPEIVSDATPVIPAGDDVQLAIELHRILDDAEWRRRIVEAGLARAAEFTPERTAEGTLAAYRSAAAPE